MNKRTLILVSSIIFLFSSNQLVSMHFLNEEQDQLQPNEQPNKQLLKAAETGNAQAVEEALAQGADVNYTDNTGKTALMNACAKGHRKIARILIKHGADVNHADRYCCMTALQDAAWNGYGKIVRLLIEHDANIHRGALMEAVPYCTTDTIRLLIEHGADVNHTNNCGGTILMLAARYGRTDIAKILMEEHSVNVNQDNNVFTTTSLIEAAKVGRIDLVRLLLEHGAHINHKDNKGNTALHYAACYGNIAVVKLLLAAGAHLDINNHDGYTAWGIANSKSKLRGRQKARTCAQFLEHNVVKTILWNLTRDGRHEGRLGNLPPEVTTHIASYVMARDNHGNTPLHNAVLCNKIDDVISLLNDSSADVNIRNNDGNTPLHLAIQNSGNTWLHIGIQRNHAGIAQALLTAGANYTIRNNRNEVPLDLIQGSSKNAIMDVLRREIIIPEILRDEKLFQQLIDQGRRVLPGMPEEIIARIVGFLPNPHHNF